MINYFIRKKDFQQYSVYYSFYKLYLKFLIRFISKINLLLNIDYQCILKYIIDKLVIGIIGYKLSVITYKTVKSLYV